MITKTREIVTEVRCMCSSFSFKHISIYFSWQFILPILLFFLPITILSLRHDLCLPFKYLIVGENEFDTKLDHVNEFLDIPLNPRMTILLLLN